MRDDISQDPYRLGSEDIEDPPRKFSAIFRSIGPGLILAGSVVGPGELVATPVLGAEIGYTLLWLILLSCIVKVVVQNELGRYTIATGETALEAFDRIPAPRFLVSWIVWLWLLLIILTMFSMGGMLGAMAEILNRLFPVIALTGWVWIVSCGTVVLVGLGRYGLVEKVSLVLTVLFSVLTVGAVALLFKSPQYFSWAGVVEGLSFRLPEEGLITAVAAFGITGMASTELVAYPYWCLEKGYARFAGPRDATDAWQRRARGWIRVMGVDVLNCMVIYTLATVAFYLLGAGILHGMGILPQGSEMVKILSNMYTETLGSWSLYVFLVGALAATYSTLFAVIASFSRGMADLAGIAGLYDKSDYTVRLKATRISVVPLALIPTLLLFLVREPVVMTKITGVAQSVMLPIIGFATLYLRYVHMPKKILPKGWITLTLWVASVVMLVPVVYLAIKPL